MTLSEFNTILTGIAGYSEKVAYYAFPEKEAPALPFICWMEASVDTFPADGIVYHSAHGLRVELYTKTKNTTEEEKVEAALTAAGIFFTKECQHIDDEKCWLTLYSMEV